MKENILDKVANLLKSNSNYVTDDGELLKAKVYSDIMTMNEALLKLLLSDEDIKKTFFTNINDTLVFDKQKFAWLIDSKEFLPDSYTAYTNKIGLTSNNDFIANNNDVVLDFPYKDCILEGGQTKDDQDRKEIFYNETLAQDEIRGMLDPKVFTNAKRYTKDGVEEGITFNEDDNLIIKGNNLIALASLLKRYEGQVKCIYIDPPYYFVDKKEYDAFKYNSNFKKSTWLNFLKARIDIAWRLLSEDGTMWLHVGEDGMHYLKVLLDEILGSEAFVGTIPRKTREGKNDVPFNFSQDFDFILLYTKATEKSNVIWRSIKRDYIETPDFPGRPWRRGDIKQQKNSKERPNSDFDMINPKTGKVYPVDKNSVWRVTKDTFEEWYRNGYIGFPDDYEFMSGELPFRRSFKDEDEQKDGKSSVFSDYLLKDFIKQLMGKSKNATNDIINSGEFNYAKPESLLKSILEICTNENDLVLDFFMGSATTQAVAMKLKRRFIGIEQMDYIEDITVERLKKVIEGEQGGISKAVDWQGGGSFVYCELKENAQELIDSIQACDETNIKEIKEKIYNDDRIIPYLTKNELVKTDNEFEELSLEDKKKALITLVDKNKLYVNYSDIDNKDYEISEDERRFSKSFYEVK